MREAGPETHPKLNKRIRCLPPPWSNTRHHQLKTENILQDPRAQIKIGDFGESFIYDISEAEAGGVKRKIHCPRTYAAPRTTIFSHKVSYGDYAAPEILFDGVGSPASDVWALGNLNVLHAILDGGTSLARLVIPAPGGASDDEVLVGMVRLFGKLPVGGSG
ncbi:hypothetical protein EUX98_g3931 [Antrodiella citrinella]|uniref:Protein kinase domain-containing protein n=1 Tax=Antrodiella citrinella TaxID=2447956 RepID=A0A4S4MV90_9APHY|nr:hypothetical protein EUX98_g3931 [Antrodiella citrinella]